MSPVCNLKGLLQVFEIKLVSPSGSDIMALIFCDTACNIFWTACSLADRKGLQKTKRVTVKVVHTEAIVDTTMVELSVKSEGIQNFGCIRNFSYVENILNVG